MSDIRPASTILLLRDLDPVKPGFEVFMIERSSESRFMGGAYVFPGGRVEDDDAALAGDVTPEEADALFPADANGAALAYLGAARRELTEEALVELPPDAVILPFAHWITPAIETRRFDTWFFVAVLPPGLEPGHDDHEAVASRWVDPRTVIAADSQPTLPLPPPTYHCLWDLARFDHAAEVLADAASREISACTPALKMLDAGPTIVLPGDPLHPSETPMHGPSRLHLGRDDAWWAVVSSSSPTK